MRFYLSVGCELINIQTGQCWVATPDDSKLNAITCGVRYSCAQYRSVGHYSSLSLIPGRIIHLCLDSFSYWWKLVTGQKVFLRLLAIKSKIKKRNWMQVARVVFRDRLSDFARQHLNLRSEKRLLCSKSEKAAPEFVFYFWFSIATNIFPSYSKRK